jgi:hypothetical protein
VVVILLLAAIQLVVVGSVASSGDESSLSEVRVQGIRGFYAGESGAIIGAKSLMSGLTLPSVGSSLSLGNASVKYVAVPDPVVGGELVLDGSSGQVSRRIRVVLADPLSP